MRLASVQVSRVKDEATQGKAEGDAQAEEGEEAGVLAREPAAGHEDGHPDLRRVLGRRGHLHLPQHSPQGLLK